MQFLSDARRFLSNSERGVKFLLTLEGDKPVFIKPECLGQFYAEYSRAVFIANGDYGIAEVPPAAGPVPLVITGCFRWNNGFLVPLEYHDALMAAIVTAYQRALTNVMELSATGSELFAVRLNSVIEDERGTFLHYRLQFPYCRIDPAMQRKQLRAQALEILNTLKVFNTMSVLPVIDWETNISSAPLTKLELFGSMPAPNIRPLDYVCSYSYNNGLPYVLEDASQYVMQNYHTLIKDRIDLADPRDGNFVLWLPILLSMHYGQSQTLLRGDSVTHVIDESPHQVNPGDLHDKDHLGVARQLLPLINKDRYHNKFYFRHIGRALHSAAHGQEAGLRLFVEQAARAGIDVAECGDFYHTMDPHFITYKTIAWYAKMDNFELYKRWHAEWSEPEMLAATSGGHARVAKALYKTYWLEFCNRDISPNSWYQYREHRWNHIQKGYALNIILTEDFCDYFAAIRTQFSAERGKKTGHSENEAKRQARNDTIESTVDKISKLFKQLESDPYKERVMKQAMYYFYDERFADHYDNAANLMCVRSGVWEMEEVAKVQEDTNRPFNPADYLFFRPGQPEDYLTMSTGVAYDAKLDNDSYTVRRVREWYTQLMVEPDLLLVLERFTGSMPYGGNLDKNCTICTGPPDAGKSTWTRGICLALDKYAIKGDPGVLSSQRSGDGPSPSLARARGTRVMFYEELEAERGVISAGFVKRSTGNDTFFARKLHENGGEIDPLYKTVMVCNLVPQFSSFDEGIKRRVFIIPFTSRWVANPPLDPTEQMRTRTFSANRFFTHNMLDLARGLLWLMGEWYPYYARYGLPRPQKILTVNEKYWADNDYYQAFIRDNISQQLLPDGQFNRQFTVLVDEVVAEFNNWFRTNYKNMKAPNGNIVRENLGRRMGEPEFGRWIGYGITGGQRHQGPALVR